MGRRRTVRKVQKKKSPWYKVIAVIVFCAVFVCIFIVGKTLLTDKNNEVTAPSLQSLKPMQWGKDEDEIQLNGYAISSSSTEASEAGAKILESGGNAADAAVAIAYTLAVTEPYGSGLGGGGSMVIYDPITDEYYFYNYASEASSSGFSSQILIPGFVSGMDAVNEDFGTKELEVLLEPAIQYCDGFAINEEFETRIERASGMLEKESAFYVDGHWLKEGDELVQPELKNTLQILSSEGAQSFYSGTIAEMLVENTGMTKEDLEAYETIRTSPVISTYREYEIASAAAPYSGETLIQMLKMTETLDIEEPSDDNEAFLRKLEKATLVSHAERLKHVYDLRFSENGNNQNQRVTDVYVNNLLNLDIGDIEIEEESEDTTGFTVIDSNGMVVSCTNTLSHFWGSKVNVGGFYLNNSGVNFGSGVNVYESGKRPRTHISPTILKSENEIIAIASPGGNAIVKVLSEVVMDICRFRTNPQEAVNKRRLLFVSEGVIYYETGYETDLLADVSGSGYKVIPIENHSIFGNVALSRYRVDSGYDAVKDVRRNGDYKVADDK